MSESLFICNTVYQLFVALWIKSTYFSDEDSDIIISDHMNGSLELHHRLSRETIFQNCYYVQNYNYIHGDYYDDCRNKITRMRMLLNPKKYLKKYFHVKRSYSKLFVSNMDNFAKVIFDVVSRKRKCDLYLFEDGIGSYAEIYNQFYNDTRISYLNRVEDIIGRCIIKQKSIYGNVSGMYLFNTDILGWNAEFPLVEMKKVNRDNQAFKDLCNRVFDYSHGIDSDAYSKKYIFMEESYFSEGVPINDVELVEEISKNVGKNNVSVKIHPRNKINRFWKAGYVTNSNTGIPWEVIVMNMDDIQNHVFITVASSSVVNMILIFGERIKAFSLYDLLNNEAKRCHMLSGVFWETIKRVYEKYPDMITVCHSVNEIL